MKPTWSTTARILVIAAWALPALLVMLALIWGGRPRP
jgi:hypothetical protein